MASEKICASCAFWMMPDPKAPNKEMGQCRWGPPQVAVVMASPPPVSDQEKRIIQMAGAKVAPQVPQPVFLSIWPNTKAEQGCGRWEKSE